MALFSLLAFYYLAELPPAEFPTQAQEYVDLFKQNFVKSSFIVWQRKVETPAAIVWEICSFPFCGKAQPVFVCAADCWTTVVCL